MTPQHGFDLDQHRTQAKELLKLARAADPQAIERIRTHHPEHDFVLKGQIKLADAQLVIARELGFGSWAKLKEDLLFRIAVHYLDTGKIEALDALLQKYPALIKLRCYHGEEREGSYANGATLLDHVAGNPIRCPLPANIVDIARLLLERGADPNSVCDHYSKPCTTIGLILTGKQVSEAGVSGILIDILKAAGAKDDLDRADLLTDPLWNGGRATAEELVRRGAKMDLRHAAALGRIDVMERLLVTTPSSFLIEEALIYASEHGETEAARLLLEIGAKGDIFIGATSSIPHVYAAKATALHNAAYRGHMDFVKLLLGNGADPTVIEPTYNGTAADWARHAGHTKVVKMLAKT